MGRRAGGGLQAMTKQRTEIYYRLSVPQNDPYRPAPPAILEQTQESGRKKIALKRWTFRGGYGDDSCRPTQTGCALIADWMDERGLSETPMTLTNVLREAQIIQRARKQ